MDDKQNKLNELLRELSDDDTRIDDGNMESYIFRLQDIYEGDFRHMYSGIFGTITGIDAAPHQSLINLAGNIKLLHDTLKDWQEHHAGHISPELCKNMDKLNDHINLDIARIEYTRQMADQINEKNKATNSELKKIGDKAEQMQKDYVTILGIFSSIVVTFVAGMVFSSSVLSNIDKASIYRLFFVMIMIALMLFNLLNMLLEFIQKVNNRTSTPPPPPGGAGQKQAAIVGINVVLLFMLVIDIIFWGLYWWRSMHPDGWMSF